MHKTQDEEKQIKKHNITCVANKKNHNTNVLDTTIHKTQDEDKQIKKHNITCVGHHYAQDTRRREANKKTQHNMCWTPLYTRHKTKTNK